MTSSADRFAALVAVDGWGLVDACLALAEDAYPGLDAAAYVRRIDAMSATIRARVAADAFAEQRIAALNHHLFGELGFRGNVEAYHDPRNSYLNDVLDRRIGIPITLSILYMEVGRQVGLAIDGVSFPGHFLVRVRTRRGHLILDPFAGGVPVGEEALRTLLRRAIGGERAGVEPLERFLGAAENRDVLARVLRNLKNVHLEAGRHEKALAIIDRILVVTPDAAEEVRDRGLVYRRLECFRPALADLGAYLALRPDAPDAADIRAIAAELARMVSRLN